MRSSGIHITVCICTYQRPALLKKLLTELGRQDSGGLFTFSAVVADNDQAESARPVVAETVAGVAGGIVYCVETRRNIALARNKTLENAKGDFIVFIDDDEFPVPGWLLALYNTCEKTGADGVLAPVKPWFETEPAAWIIKGGFCDRPGHPTGFVMNWKECRTGNVLFRSRILEGEAEPFRAQFGTGGEDVDFFRRMSEKGHKFVWCDEAVAYEAVPPNRLTRSYMLKRGLLRGANSLKNPRGRWLNVVKSLVALPFYTLALPFLLVAGQHHFMKFLIKVCDHGGRLLALVNLSPQKREM